MGRPWQFNGQDSVLQTQGAQVSSLVRELRVHVLGSMAKKKKKASPLKTEASPMSLGTGGVGRIDVRRTILHLSLCAGH